MIGISLAQVGVMAQSVLGGVFLHKLLDLAPYKARRSDHHAHSITASRTSASFSICPKAIVYCFWVATVGVYFPLGVCVADFDAFRLHWRCCPGCFAEQP